MNTLTPTSMVKEATRITKNSENDVQKASKQTITDSSGTPNNTSKAANRIEVDDENIDYRLGIEYNAFAAAEERITGRKRIFEGSLKLGKKNTF